MERTVTLMQGEGIGPEIAAAAREIIDASGVVIRWEEVKARAEMERRGGGYLAAEAITSVERNGYGLKGPMTTPIAAGPPSINVGLRKALDLYANLRPVKNLPGVKTRFEGVDLVIVRENTEDLYSGIEHEVVPGVVESIKIITEKASTRIARFAFEYARRHGRKKVATVHKANIMKQSDGLFLGCTRAVANEFREIEYREVIVDNACMQLVLNPGQFDVMVMPNLYGDVVSDLCAGLVGGLGLVPSGNIGEKAALFEAVHGTAPDIAGRGIANPTALVLSGVMMLRHMGETGAAERIQAAVEKVYQEGRWVTRDVGGKATTAEFTKAVIGGMR
ncbi:MAG TPA: isocitrate dehydrogenase (NAD(+)) [Candidatus Acidoferrales bacterium]|nr:isocitrate dehydrogenase (NAD(+)) [Candidatus Acidoferrales bacterium]